jgi:hypothetical protein
MFGDLVSAMEIPNKTQSRGICLGYGKSASRIDKLLCLCMQA